MYDSKNNYEGIVHKYQTPTIQWSLSKNNYEGIIHKYPTPTSQCSLLKNNYEGIVHKYLTPTIQWSLETIKFSQIFYIIYLKNISLKGLETSEKKKKNCVGIVHNYHTLTIH